jgi:hypothetical protein
MVVTTSADRLREILQVGKLAALGCVGEVCRKLVQLVRRTGVALRLSGLSGALQVGGNLLRHLSVLDGVRLLKLLQRADQLRKWGELSTVRRRRGHHSCRAARVS